MLTEAVKSNITPICSNSEPFLFSLACWVMYSQCLEGY